MLVLRDNCYNHAYLLHNSGLPNRSNGMALLVRRARVRKVASGVLQPRLKYIRLRDGVEDRNLLCAERDDRHRVRGANLAANGVLVRDVGGDLHRGDGKGGEGQRADGNTPHRDEEIVVTRRLGSNLAEETPGGYLDIGEVSDRVVDRSGTVTSGDEPVEEFNNGISKWYRCH